MRPWTSWIEIPALDLDRAISFYASVFDISIQKVDLGVLKMGVFPHGDVGAALCQHPEYRPSATDGLLVYLNASPDLQPILDRVEPAGGRIVRPKTAISPEHGFMALFTDSEGNRIALHSDQ
jgi:uncharacterized protein